VLKDNDRSIVPFYIDGVQVEALASAAETVSTYIDGDQIGLVANQQPPAYLWTGTPHASTSQRSGLTRAGGMVVKFKDYNFLISAIIGLGLAGVQNVSTEYARIDGGYPDYTRKPSRQFSLVGTFQGRSYQQLRDDRGDLAHLFDRDVVGLDQPLILQHYVDDGCGNPISNVSRIPCKYAGGLDGNTDNHAMESASVAFTQYLPFVQSDGEAGASITVQSSFTANAIAIRSPTGTWASIGTGSTTGEVRALAFGKTDEYLYIGGAFTSFNGVANTTQIARYSLVTGTVTAMGTGAAGAAAKVYALATAPNGHVWAAGTFTSMGGAANSAVVAEWDGSAWSGHTYPSGAAGTTVTIDKAGNVYIGDTGGAVYKWDGSAWTLLGTATGSLADIYVLSVGPDGNLYAGGSFTGGLVAGANSIARYTLPAAAPAWQTLNNAPATVIYQAMAFGPNGILYTGPTNLGAGSTSLVSYNGTTFATLVTPTAGSAALYAIVSAPNNLIYFGGVMVDPVNGVILPDSVAIYQGSVTSALDVNLPGVATILAIAQRIDGTLVLGYDTTGTAVAAGITTLTNTGTAKSYPTLRIAGPSSGTSRIYQIINETTGRAIYLNYTIAAGETATLQFTPDNLSFQSNFSGNIASKILPGSSEADLFLQPGTNIISLYSADNTVTAALYWRPAFALLDDVP